MKTVALFKQAATVTNTATITLGAAIEKYRTLQQVIAAGDAAAGDTGLAICVRDPATGAFEFGTYTITNGTTLTRVTVEESSNADSAVAFGGATVEVYSALPPSYLNGTSLTDVLAANPAGTLLGTDVIMVARNSGLFGTTLSAIAAAVASINGGTAPATPTVTGVSVTPATVSVAGGGSQTFTAAVSGTNSPAQTVTWSATAGSITSGGVFTAPAATGSTQTITITATSTADTSKKGTATVTIGAASSTVTGVTVSPSTANVAGGGSQTFTAAVAGTNSPSQSVNWGASAGSITSGGVFTAPVATSSAQTITITATSAQDNTKSGTATVTVAAVVAGQYDSLVGRYRFDPLGTSPETYAATNDSVSSIAAEQGGVWSKRFAAGQDGTVQFKISQMGHFALLLMGNFQDRLYTHGYLAFGDFTDLSHYQALVVDSPVGTPSAVSTVVVTVGDVVKVARTGSTWICSVSKAGGAFVEVGRYTNSYTGMCYAAIQHIGSLRVTELQSSGLETF